MFALLQLCLKWMWGCCFFHPAQLCLEYFNWKCWFVRSPAFLDFLFPLCIPLLCHRLMWLQQKVRSWNVLKTFTQRGYRKISPVLLTSCLWSLRCLQVFWACRRVWTCTGTSSARGGAASARLTPRPSSARWNSRCSPPGWAASQNWVSTLSQHTVWGF